jgi:V-type H+-transporting ATPase subunit d
MSEMMNFNIDEGFSESLVRVMKKSFLEEEDYIALKNANNLVDFKTALETTDYEEILLQEPSPIPVQRLTHLLKQKLADDLNYIQAQASEPLYEFINLMRHGYMIENTVYFIEGIKAKSDKDRLLARADPLGEFPGLKTISAAESENYASVYQTVLIDLPVGKYFHKFLEDIMVGSAAKDINSIDSIMKDYTQDKIKNLLKKIWLTEMYKFCTTKLEGPSREIMEHLLKFESDCMTMQVIYNSLGNKELLEAKGREADRKQYIHLLGYLYPGRDKELTAADSLEKLKAAVA